MQEQKHGNVVDLKRDIDPEKVAAIRAAQEDYLPPDEVGENPYTSIKSLILSPVDAVEAAIGFVRSKRKH